MSQQESQQVSVEHSSPQGEKQPIFSYSHARSVSPKQKKEDKKLSFLLNKSIRDDQTRDKKQLTKEQKLELIKKKEKFVNEVLLGKVQVNQKKKSSKETVQRLLSYQQKLQEKKQSLKEKYQQQIEKNATFQPNKKEKSEQKLSFQEFLSKQQKFQENKSKKIELMIEKKQEQELQELNGQKTSFVSKKSALILKNKNDTSQVQDKVHQKEKKEEQKQVNTFVPVVNKKSAMMQRDKKVIDILYEDAMRRKTQVTVKEVEPVQQTILTKQSKEILKNKLEKQIKEAFLNLIIKEEEISEQQIDSQKIDNEDLEKLLQSLQFIVETKSEEKQNTQQQLLKQMWQELGNQNQGVYYQHLKQFLFIVMGYFNSNESKVEETKVNEQVQELQENQENHQTQKTYGVLNGQQYEISKNQYCHICKDFKLFYNNYTENQKSNKNPTFKEKIEQPSFKPNLSKGTKQVQVESKEKITRKDAQSYANKQKEAKLKQLNKREQAKQEQEQKKIEECTFKPHMNTKAEVQGKSFGAQRNVELYNKAKEIKEKRETLIKKKGDEQVENVCTFKPDTAKSLKSKKLIEKKVSNAHGVDNAIERLQQARRNKEIIDQMKQKGFPNTTKQEMSLQAPNIIKVNYSLNKSLKFPDKTFDNQENENSNTEKSLIYLDINLGQNRTERIIVYEGDQAEEVALKFVKSHNLDQSVLPKLKQIIGEEINKMQNNEYTGKSEYKLDQDEQDLQQQNGSQENQQEDEEEEEKEEEEEEEKQEEEEEEEEDNENNDQQQEDQDEEEEEEESNDQS